MFHLEKISINTRLVVDERVRGVTRAVRLAFARSLVTINSSGKTDARLYTCSNLLAKKMIRQTHKATEEKTAVKPNNRHMRNLNAELKHQH